MFLKADPWERQYFEKWNLDSSFQAPVDDSTAWNYYPTYNWLYNKMALCKAQGIDAVPHGATMRTPGPYYSKPIINLWGMSNGSKPVDAWDDKHYQPGHMLMPMLKGDQISVDIALKNGKVVWWGAFRPNWTPYGSFSEWVACEPDPSYFMEVRHFVEHHLPGHWGVINVEMIGPYIIDFHLRMSPQFVDLYGSGWLGFVASLYKKDEEAHWYGSNGSKGGISAVVRLKGKPTLDLAGIRPRIMSFKPPSPAVTSVQEIWHYLDSSFEDGQSTRVAVVNGYDKDAVMGLQASLQRAFDELCE